MYLASATAPGSAHINPGQPSKINNQDALAIRHHDTGHIAVLCDGCGSYPLSGTGADIGANIIANEIYSQLSASVAVKNFDWDKLTLSVRRALRDVAERIFGKKNTTEEFERLIVERFLFTSMVLLTDNDTAVVASFGDGLVIVDDEHTQIDAPILNSPPYIGYLLLKNSGYHTKELRKHLAFSVVTEVPINEIEKGIVIATDGIKPLAQEDWHHPALVQPRQLQQWLNVQTTERIKDGMFIKGKCPDDATVVIFRTDESQQRLIESRREVAELKQNITVLRGEVTSLTRQLQTTTVNYQSALQRYSELQARAAQLKSRSDRVDELEQSLQVLRRSIGQLKPGQYQLIPKMVSKFFSRFNGKPSLPNQAPEVSTHTGRIQVPVRAVPDVVVTLEDEPVVLKPVEPIEPNKTDKDEPPQKKLPLGFD